MSENITKSTAIPLEQFKEYVYYDIGQGHVDESTFSIIFDTNMEEFFSSLVVDLTAAAIDIEESKYNE